MSKVTLSFEVEEAVGAVLAEAAKARGEDVAQLLRALAEDYARERQEIAEAIREADATPEEDWIPHEEAMEQVRASLEAQIASKAAGER